MISVTIRKVLFIMRWGNKIPEEWTEGRKDLQKQWKQKTLKGKGHWSLVNWWGLGPQNLDRRGKKSFLINANQGNELQCVCLWHQQDSLFPWSHPLACLSYPILHPNPPSFHPRWEVFCLSPYPETGPWERSMQHGGLNVIVIYQLLLSRTEMTNGEQSHCYLYR